MSRLREPSLMPLVVTLLCVAMATAAAGVVVNSGTRGTFCKQTLIHMIHALLFCLSVRKYMDFIIS